MSIKLNLFSLFTLVLIFVIFKNSICGAAFIILRIPIITAEYHPEEQTITKHLVSIQIHSYKHEYFGAEHICGGCILGPRIILTAAHCLAESHVAEPRMPRTIRVIAKTRNRLVKTADTSISYVREIRIHPLYNPDTLENDIAIAKLANDIKLDDQFAQIVPLTNQSALAGTHCTVIGWGRILENGPMAANVTYANVDIAMDDMCSIYPVYKEGMLCVSNIFHPGMDACTGDSGGPLICQLKLVGLVSFGIGCASGFPSVYTDVWFYRNWIMANRSYRCHGRKDLIILMLIFVVCSWQWK